MFCEYRSGCHMISRLRCLIGLQDWLQRLGRENRQMGQWPLTLKSYGPFHVTMGPLKSRGARADQRKE